MTICKSLKVFEITLIAALASVYSMSSAGASDGLGFIDHLVLNQSDLRLESSEPGDRFGSMLARGDFNGDGHTDVAIGVPRENLGYPRATNAGIVHVLYGSSNGLGQDSENSNILQTTVGAEGIGTSVQFGDTLEAGDFDNDGYDDLVIGTPVLGDSTGHITLVFGSSHGLNNGKAPQILPNYPIGTRDELQGSARYHEIIVLSAGDFNGDSFDDLAVGTPYHDLDLTESTDNGSVTVFFGSNSGLTENIEPQVLAGYWQTELRFGQVLETGDFNDDGFDDLAVGTPRSDLANNSQFSDDGAVAIWQGSPLGLIIDDKDARQLFTSELLDPLEGRTGSEFFGASLASGDVNGDGFPDLIVGSPHKTFGLNWYDGYDGAIAVLFGSASGLNGGKKAELLNELTAKVGFPETNDRFGGVLELGDFNNDGYDDLVIGLPDETFVRNDSAGSRDELGFFAILCGSPEGLIESSCRNVFGRRSVGLSALSADETIGEALLSGDFNGDGIDDLMVGIPSENEGSGAVAILVAGNEGEAAVPTTDAHDEAPVAAIDLDLTKDGAIGMGDLRLLRESFGRRCDQPGYNSAADVGRLSVADGRLIPGKDCRVDINDLYVLARNFGKSLSPPICSITTFTDNAAIVNQAFSGLLAPQIVGNCKAEICESGALQYRVDDQDTAQAHSCCSGISYDPARQICVAGRLFGDVENAVLAKLKSIPAGEVSIPNAEGITFRYLPDSRELGLRLGNGLLSKYISDIELQTLYYTNYNRKTLYGFEFDGVDVAARQLLFGFEYRYEKLESYPVFKCDRWFPWPRGCGFSTSRYTVFDGTAIISAGWNLEVESRRMVDNLYVLDEEHGWASGLYGWGLNIVDFLSGSITWLLEGEFIRWTDMVSDLAIAFIDLTSEQKLLAGDCFEAVNELNQASLIYMNRTDYDNRGVWLMFTIDAENLSLPDVEFVETVIEACLQ